MSIQKTQGIVLHSTPYSETSLIAHIYTEHFGRQSYLIRGVRKSGGKSRMALFQPLSILEMEVSHSSKREIQHLREARIHAPCLAIHTDPIKNTLAMFMAEILWRTLRTEEPNLSLFSFLVGIIQMLDLAPQAPANFHLYFLVQLTKYIGFWPFDNYSDNCCYFNLASGKFTESLPDHHFIQQKDISRRIHQFLSLRSDQLSELKLNRAERFELAETLLLYYRIHLEGMGAPKSLAMMKEIFSTGRED